MERRVSIFLISAALFAALIGLSTRTMPWMLSPEYCCRPLGNKIEEWRATRVKPDLVILGSSLTLVPAARCDDEFHAIPARTDGWWYCDTVVNYNQADYFQHLLARRGSNVRVDNLSISGAMVSDDLSILRRMIRDRRKPKFVLCCLAPRDFVSNDSGSGEYSCISTCIKKLHQQYPELGLMRYPLLAAAAMKMTETHEYFDVRRLNVRTLITTLAESLAGKKKFQPQPGVVDGAFQPSYVERVNELGSLSLYNERYNPPNFAQCKEQIGYLDILLDTCQKEGIAVTVVNMPLPRENLALLKPDLLALYKNGMARECKKYHVQLIDCQSDSFALSEFEDACHLNARGGKRVFSKLAAQIAPVICGKEHLM